VRSTETACPFCEATLSGKCELPHAGPLGRVSSRAVLTFFAAAAITGCGKTTPPEERVVTTTVYGPPPMAMDASAPAPMIVDPDGKDGGK
jgi:hypothetical protein